MVNFLTDIQVEQLIGDLRQEQRAVNDAWERRVLALEKEINPDRQPSVQLKPCPFCGTVETLAVRQSERGHYFSVCCCYCGVTGPTRRTEDQAKVRWNKQRQGISDVEESEDKVLLI